MTTLPTEIPDVRDAATTVDVLAHELIAVVAREAEQLDALWQSLSQQQRLLVEGDVAGVEGAVRDQERLLRTSRDLEAARCRLLDRLAGQLSDDPRELTLSRLTELLTGSYARRLGELKATLVGITDNILRARRQNEMLINRSLFHIGETMRLLAGSMATVPAYSACPSARRPGAALVNRVG